MGPSDPIFANLIEEETRERLAEAFKACREMAASVSRATVETELQNYLRRAHNRGRTLYIVKPPYQSPVRARRVPYSAGKRVVGGWWLCRLAEVLPSIVLWQRAQVFTILYDPTTGHWRKSH